jgi:DNA replication protein DnaC
MKRGFTDREIAARLDWLLSSDFLAIDEMGKEHKGKSGRDFTGAQVERILKARYDDSLPTLLASNADPEALEAMYGATFASMILGKFKTAVLEPGDFRERTAKRMSADMGY